MKRSAAVLLAVSLLGGCSLQSTLTPFTSLWSSKEKVPDLQPINATATIRLQWQASVGSAGDNTFSPAIVGDSVYAAAADGTVARFDNGREVWRVRAEQSLTGGAGADGKRVVVGTLKGEVLAFDSNGKPLWKAKVNSEVLAAPAVADNLVVVRSGDNRITAFAADSGKKVWAYQRPTPALTLRSSTGVTIGNRMVFAGFPGGKLVALSMANGAPVWEGTVALPKGSTELERIADVTSDPVFAGRQVCATAFQGRVACFDASSGESLWARDMSSSRGLDVDRQYLYVTDDKGNLYALDKDNGASIWKQDKLAGRGVTGPLSIPGYVAVADAKGVVHLLRRTDGAFVARLETDGYAVNAPLKTSGATFLVQTSKGGLFSLAP